MFRFSDLFDAYDQAKEKLYIYADCAALVKENGGALKLVQGDARLYKVTQSEDFAIAERLWAFPTDQMRKENIQEMQDIRVGQGFDVHAFKPGNEITLCGVKIAHKKALLGHSDADVAWHALADALLGAAGLGDIGQHFPPDDERWRGAASILFLEHILEKLQEMGAQIMNLDLTLICETPKIGPYRDAMRDHTAQTLNIAQSRVNIKATTTEQLGFTGRKEGIAAQAIATLRICKTRSSKPNAPA